MKCLFVSFCLLVVSLEGSLRVQPEVTGVFSPVGPPAVAPTRVPAGPGCVVDLAQRYEVSGALAGQMEIDYRILIRGPCGAPAGTFQEEWIARGTFSGTLEGNATSASFAYTAEVGDGGEVTGSMVFGGGLHGEVAVSGRLSDGELRYSGDLAFESGARGRF